MQCPCLLRTLPAGEFCFFLFNHGLFIIYSFYIAYRVIKFLIVLFPSHIQSINSKLITKMTIVLSVSFCFSWLMVYKFNSEWSTEIFSVKIENLKEFYHSQDLPRSFFRPKNVNEQISGKIIQSFMRKNQVVFEKDTSRISCLLATLLRPKRNQAVLAYEGKRSGVPAQVFVGGGGYITLGYVWKLKVFFCNKSIFSPKMLENLARSIYN